MDLAGLPYQIIDWSALPAEVKPGAHGTVTQRVAQWGPIRIRRVDYSAGYAADHWCAKGHIIYVLSGELVSELKSGARHTMRAGMSYHVADQPAAGAEIHRSTSTHGASLFIVD